MNRLYFSLILLIVLVPLSNGQCYDTFVGQDENHQGQWRLCSLCSGLFFDGYSDNKGVCPAGGSHEDIGDYSLLPRHNFVLPHDISGDPCHQTDWRFCGKCSIMFYDGYPDNKGVCPAGGSHEAIGYNFALPHDITDSGGHQEQWRFCSKCSGMFYNGYYTVENPRYKGVCPAGGSHEAIGYNFALPFGRPTTFDPGTALVPVED